MISYLKHTEIDKTKWDHCIDEAVNSLIYAYSWYLDIVSPGWDALIEDDYEAVMPLTWRKKWGIRYVFKPVFVQQLGIFSKKDINKEYIIQFLASVPSHFSFFHYNLNDHNKITEGNRSVQLIRNNNHEIFLSDYDSLSRKYNRNCRRNINKAEKAGLKVSEDNIPHEFVRFISKNLGELVDDLKKHDFGVLEAILKTALERKCGEIYNVVDPKEETVASGSFLITDKRCVFFVCASTTEGKQNQSMYLLVDHVIKKYAGTSRVFDFSGSNIPGIAYFNSTFGSEIKKYPTVKMNLLPWPLKYFKR